MHDSVRIIIERFGLAPHPEGGFFREIFRSPVVVEQPDAPARRLRSSGTFIYFLLGGDDFSAFHRVRSADEIWHLYAGGPLELHTLDEEHGYGKHMLESDPLRGAPAYVVPAGCWQAARPAPGSPFAFCGCTVSPAFDFEDFEMPPAEELAARFASHERIVRELTRR